MNRASALGMLISCGVVAAACNAIFGLEAPELDPSACLDAVDCDDDNPCTVDRCDQGQCDNVSGPNVSVEQTAGDCAENRCDVDGNVEVVVDDDDQPDDENDCTLEECRSGQVFVETAVLGSRCDNGNRFCDAEGRCVQCLTEGDCAASNFCVSYACEMGECVPSFTAEETPLPTDVDGDCMREVCDGEGSAVTAVDLADVLNDGEECTEDLCTAGGPTNLPFNEGGMCGQGAATQCENGVCVGCTQDNNCPAAVPCTQFTCDIPTGVCMVDHTGPAPSNMAGDCQLRVCNMEGGIDIVNDPNDAPDDGNDCTVTSCSSGSPITTELPLNAPCGPAEVNFCDANGTCVECTDPEQCPDGANACVQAVCDGTCGVSDRPSGFVIQQQVDGDCQRQVCDGMGQITSQDFNTDVPNDDNECTNDSCVAGVPSSPPHVAGTICSGGYCSASTCYECVFNSHCDVSSGECCSSSSNTCFFGSGSGCMTS